MLSLSSPQYNFKIIDVHIFSNLTVAEVQSWAESFERLMSSLSKGRHQNTKKKKYEFFHTWSRPPPPPPGSMKKYTLGGPKSEKFFFVFLNELDHSKHFLKDQLKSMKYDL